MRRRVWLSPVNTRILSAVVSCVWLVAGGCAETVGDPQFLPVPPAGETAAASRDIRDYPAAIAAPVRHAAPSRSTR